MTDEELQDLAARVRRLEGSAWRWRAFASVLGVLFLVLASLGVLLAVDAWVRRLPPPAAAVRGVTRVAVPPAPTGHASPEGPAFGTTVTHRLTTGRAGPTKRMPREPEPGGPQ